MCTVTFRAATLAPHCGTTRPSEARHSAVTCPTVGARLSPWHNDQHPESGAFRGPAGLCTGGSPTVECAKRARGRTAGAHGGIAPLHHSDVQRPRLRQSHPRLCFPSAPVRTSVACQRGAHACPRMALLRGCAARAWLRAVVMLRSSVDRLCAASTDVLMYYCDQRWHISVTASSVTYSAPPLSGQRLWPIRKHVAASPKTWCPHSCFRRAYCPGAALAAYHALCK